MQYFGAYLASFALFMIIDLVWIKAVMRPIFERTLGDILLPDPRMGAAVVFFILYQAGLLYFAILPAVDSGSWIIAAVHGALMGVIAYGTYESTNLATLKGWTLRMAAIDVSWGAGLSALTSVAGYLVFDALA